MLHSVLHIDGVENDQTLILVRIGKQEFSKEGLECEAAL